MDLKGQITYKDITFEYEFLNKRKVVITTEEPTKLNVVKNVREKIQKEIKNRIVLKNEVFFDFKSQPKRTLELI
ncbi:MAG TPA: hypothetical protein PK649_10900 [Vicingus sp.]|nr:hypothetical protein [Vicingus sp.]